MYRSRTALLCDTLIFWKLIALDPNQQSADFQYYHVANFGDYSIRESSAITWRSWYGRLLSRYLDSCWRCVKSSPHYRITAGFIFALSMASSQWCRMQCRISVVESSSAQPSSSPSGDSSDRRPRPCSTLEVLRIPTDGVTPNSCRPHFSMTRAESCHSISRSLRTATFLIRPIPMRRSLASIARSRRPGFKRSQPLFILQSHARVANLTGSLARRLSSNKSLSVD